MVEKSLEKSENEEELCYGRKLWRWYKQKQEKQKIEKEVAKILNTDNASKFDDSQQSVEYLFEQAGLIREPRDTIVVKDDLKELAYDCCEGLRGSEREFQEQATMNLISANYKNKTGLKSSIGSESDLQQDYDF